VNFAIGVGRPSGAGGVTPNGGLSLRGGRKFVSTLSRGIVARSYRAVVIIPPWTLVQHLARASFKRSSCDEFLRTKFLKGPPPVEAFVLKRQEAGD